jgi:16S rRNA (cytidine1402-2'-O)-methyltransferase
MLYVVGLPIGNLKDITLRALEVLKDVDLILSEDTRKTKKLLYHFKIKTPVFSYHEHTGFKKINYIIKLLKEGKKLALVSEAGTPGISDPGGFLISEVLKKLDYKIKIVPIPGPSALITALSISGFRTDKFLFLGFPPSKKRRKKFLKEIINSKYPVVFYESPYRIIKTLEELNEIFSLSGFEPQVVICRELTKKFETVYRGKLKDVLEDLKKEGPKGEFVIIVNNRNRQK